MKIVFYDGNEKRLIKYSLGYQASFKFAGFFAVNFSFGSIVGFPIPIFKFIGRFRIGARCQVDKSRMRSIDWITVTSIGYYEYEMKNRVLHMELEQIPGSCGHIWVFVIQSSITGMHNSNPMACQFFNRKFFSYKGNFL